MEIDIQKIWVLHNLDAGYKSANEFLENKFKNEGIYMNIISSMPLDLYAILLKNSSCLIGNSSSGIRECSFLGVPAINIGNRQFGRLRGKNVRDCSHSVDEIKQSIKYQIKHGSYEKSFIYGKGESGKIIAQHLSEFNLILDKTITF